MLKAPLSKKIFCGASFLENYLITKSIKGYLTAAETGQLS